MAIDFNADVTVSNTNAILTGMIGGTASRPVVPVATQIANGFTGIYVCDSTARYHYCIDGSNNLLKLDLSSGSTTPSQIVASASIGSNVIDICISPDGSTIYASLASGHITKILTSSPFTVTNVATVSTANDLAGIAFDVTNNLLRCWVSSLGGPASITLTGTVTQHGGISGGIFPSIAVSKAGTVFYAQGNSISSILTGVGFNNASSYVGGMALDDDEPESTNIYAFFDSIAGGTPGTVLQRHNIPTNVSLSNIITLPNVVPVDQPPLCPPKAVFVNDSYNPLVNPAIYVVDTAGDLQRIEA